jgi:hypothetical protein
LHHGFSPLPRTLPGDASSFDSLGVEVRADDSSRRNLKDVAKSKEKSSNYVVDLNRGLVYVPDSFQLIYKHSVALREDTSRLSQLYRPPACPLLFEESKVLFQGVVFGIRQTPHTNFVPCHFSHKSE